MWPSIDFLRRHAIPAMVSAVVPIFWAVLMPQPAIAQTKVAVETSSHSQPIILEGRTSKDDLLLDLESRFGITCEKSNDKRYKGKITNVRLGSAAKYAGLSAGDVILQVKTENDSVRIAIQRKDKVYSVKLAPEHAKLALIEPAKQTGGASDADPKKPKSKSDLEVLASRDIVLIVDRSGSMKTKDCPDGLSRWQWCRVQCTGLLEEAKDLIPTVDLVKFDSTFEDYPHSNLQKVQDLFESDEPDGATWTAGPLNDRLTNYFHRRAGDKSTKPLLIAVITDGEPTQPGGAEGGCRALEEAIIQATQKMDDPTEVKITFLEVGTSSMGHTFLYELDNLLTSKGAKYDIVKTKAFADLVRVGLKKALVEAVLEDSNQQSTPPNSTSSNASTTRRSN